MPGPKFSTRRRFFEFERFIAFDKDPGAPVGSVLLDVSIGGDGDPFIQLVVGPATSLR